MTELKVYLSSTLSDRFRRIAMSVYGYGRGSLSKAAEDALSKWCEHHEQTSATTNNASTAETRSDSSETKTTHVDPEERPETLIGTEASENVGVKSAS